MVGGVLVSVFLLNSLGWSVSHLFNSFMKHPLIYNLTDQSSEGGLGRKGMVWGWGGGGECSGVLPYASTAESCQV